MTIHYLAGSDTPPCCCAGAPPWPACCCELPAVLLTWTSHTSTETPPQDAATPAAPAAACDCICLRARSGFASCAVKAASADAHAGLCNPPESCLMLAAGPLNLSLLLTRMLGGRVTSPASAPFPTLTHLPAIVLSICAVFSPAACPSCARACCNSCAGAPCFQPHASAEPALARSPGCPGSCCSAWLLQAAASSGGPLLR